MYQSTKKHLLLTLLLSFFSIQPMEIIELTPTNLLTTEKKQSCCPCDGVIEKIENILSPIVQTVLGLVPQKDRIVVDAILEKCSFANTAIRSYLDPDYPLLQKLQKSYEISTFNELMTTTYLPENHTVLHLACINNDVGSIAAIYHLTQKHGTDLLFQADNNGCLPIHLAAAFGHSTAIIMLMYMQRNGGKDPWELIAHGDDDDNTPLHIAVKNENPQAVRTLIELANDHLLDLFFMQDNYEQTALQYAQEAGLTEIAEMLLTSIKNKMTNTVLLQLIQQDSTSYFDVNTENEAQALALLKEKYLNPIDCTICFETKHGHEYDIMDCCNQPFCTECMTEHLTACLHEGNLEELKCPNQNCSKTITEPIMRAITLHNNAIYDQYLEVSLQEYLNKDSLTRHCLTPNCVFQFLKDPDCGETIICESCKKEYCSDCLFNHNLNITCDQAKTERDPNLADDAALAWIMENTRQCAQCGNAVERSKGCNHMICRCKYEFCYVCGKKWGSLSCPFYNHPPV